jgi:hypothetical protein
MRGYGLDSGWTEGKEKDGGICKVAARTLGIEELSKLSLVQNRQNCKYGKKQNAEDTL